MPVNSVWLQEIPRLTEDKNCLNTRSDISDHWSILTPSDVCWLNAHKKDWQLTQRFGEVGMAVGWSSKTIQNSKHCAFSGNAQQSEAPKTSATIVRQHQAKMCLQNNRTEGRHCKGVAQQNHSSLWLYYLLEKGITLNNRSSVDSDEVVLSPGTWKWRDIQGVTIFRPIHIVYLQNESGKCCPVSYF